MKRTILPLLLAGFAAVVFAGCSDDDNNTPMYVVLDKNELTFEVLSSQEQARVVTVGKWEIDMDGLTMQDDTTAVGGWFTVTPVAGAGNTQLTITSAYNSAAGDRSAVLKLNGSNTAELKLTQKSGADLNELFGQGLRDNLPTNYAGDSNGKISSAEAYGITTISLAAGTLKTEDVTGLKYLPSLQQFDCSNNEIVTLDVSGNTELVKLFCESNQLTSLKLSGNPKLTELNCTYNQLTALDLAGNDLLESLHCTLNPGLASIDIRNCSAALLKTLNCNTSNSSLRTITVWKDFEISQVEGAGYDWKYPSTVSDSFQEPTE